MHERISLLVPFKSGDYSRDRDWEWLHEYWRTHLPTAEIVIGHDRRSERRWPRKPFSKTAAINDAFRRSCGDIIVILDADAFLDAKVVKHCAERLRSARKAHVRTWFVPYAHIFRLTRRATNELLCSPPWNPLRFSTPPPRCDVESTDGSGHGHRFGALCQIMPREAFELVGGCDERFRGWGAEDAAFLRALDTLWGKHRNTPNDILHLWHERIIAGTPYVQGQQTWEVRLWEGQKTDRANDWLGQKYQNATGNVEKMRALVDERPKKWWQR